MAAQENKGNALLHMLDCNACLMVSKCIGGLRVHDAGFRIVCRHREYLVLLRVPSLQLDTIAAPIRVHEL